MSSGFEGTRGVAQAHVDSGRLHVVVRVGMTPVAEMWMTGLPESERVANARCMAEAITVASESGLTPRQLAEQRAELLEALRSKVSDAELWFFESWLTRTFPSGDHDEVQRKWLKSADYEDFESNWGWLLEAIANATQQRKEPGA